MSKGEVVPAALTEATVLCYLSSKMHPKVLYCAGDIAVLALRPQTENNDNGNNNDAAKPPFFLPSFCYYLSPSPFKKHHPQLSLPSIEVLRGLLPL